MKRPFPSRVLFFLSFLLLSAALFYDFWTPSVFLAGHDTFAHDYLMWDWGWRAFFEFGRLPLWNPYLFGGWPFIASFAFCPFYPPAWLSIFFPTSLAITSQYALHLALGAAGFYAFARAAGIASVPAFFTALLYLSASHPATLVFPGHLAKAQALAWIGWAMASAAMFARRMRIRWAVGLGAAWALQLLASHAQIFYATFWMTVLYVLGAVLFGSVSSTRHDSASQNKESPSILNSERGRRMLRAAAGLAAAGAVAVGLSAVQMLPALELARVSNRRGGVDYETASFGGVPPIELLEVALPSFLGDSTGRIRLGKAGNIAFPYLGTWHANEQGAGGERLVSDYAGIWAVLFAVAGLCFSLSGKRWFFAAVMLVAALISLGAATPFFRWAYYIVPGFDRFRSPGTFLIGVHFGLFGLCALGLQEAVRRIRVWKKETLRLSAWKVWTVSLMWILFLVINGQMKNLAGLLEQPEISESAVTVLRMLLVLRAILHVLFFLALGTVFLGLWCLLAALPDHAGLSRPIARMIPLILFLGVAVWDGMSHVRRFLPKDQTENLERYLRANSLDSMILQNARGSFLPAMIEDGRELNNRPMMRGLRSLHGYHPVVYGDYEKLLAATGFFRSSVTWRHFAMNYLVQAADRPVPEGWNILHTDQTRCLLVRAAPIPFARIPRRVQPLGKRWEELNVEEWREHIGKPDFDPARETICEGAYAWEVPEHFIGGAALHEDAALRVRVQMPHPGVLELRWEQAEDPDGRRLKIAGSESGVIPCILPVPAGSGWRVRLTRAHGAGEPGRPAGPPLDAWPRRANGFFQLVPMHPDGEIVTTLSYEPASFRWGVLCTLCVLGALFIWCMAACFLRLRATCGGRGRGSDAVSSCNPAGGNLI